ncbi:MAG: hypothetical protein JKY08_00885 [Flavobacteriaceae bacterium]|nr:hypothetical protein [Flavobacteriaceae bacterium]
MIKKLLKLVSILGILLFIGCGAKNCGCGLTSEVDTNKTMEKPSVKALTEIENAR